MKKHVLYLSYDGMTDPLGQSQVLSYLRELAKEEIVFHLISFEKKERYEAHGEYILKYCEDAKIKWHPLSYTKNPPVLSALLDIKKMQKMAFQIIDQFPISFVHCRSYIPALVALKIKQKKQIDFLFDMRGFWADERLDGKIWNISNPLYKAIYNFFKRKEVEFLKESKHIISLTHRAKDEMVSWNKVSKISEKIQVIPCCADTDLFDQNRILDAEKLALKTKLKLADKDFVLGYVGSLGTWYMLREMLLLYKSLKKANSAFLFVTKEDKSMIHAEAKKVGLNKSDIVISSCLHHEVPLYMSIFDLSIFFILPAYSKMASSPVKQGELMAMGIPLICNAGVGDTDKIVEEGKAGIVLKDTREESFKNLHIPEYNSVEISNYAKNMFSLKTGVLKYTIAYRKMTS